MTLLDFTKPERVRSREAHEKMFSSDCGVPGTFVPNMSEEDADKWRAKQIGGEDPRIEIRSTRPGAQMLAVVRKDGSVALSANGKMEFDATAWQEFRDAVQEAWERLQPGVIRYAKTEEKCEHGEWWWSRVMNLDGTMEGNICGLCGRSEDDIKEDER